MNTDTSMKTLSQDSINWLQDLIQVNLDSRDGFKEAADNLKGKNPSIEALFRQLSNQRAQQASELQGIVACNAEQPTTEGSFVAAAHRTWMDLRTALGGGEHAVLSEAERGEDHIKAKYESALKDVMGCICAPTLEKHYAAVKASHDNVKMLRDGMAKK